MSPFSRYVLLSDYPERIIAQGLRGRATNLLLLFPPERTHAGASMIPWTCFELEQAFLSMQTLQAFLLFPSRPAIRGNPMLP
jgi:hypothetical protein